MQGCVAERVLDLTQAAERGQTASAGQVEDDTVLAIKLPIAVGGDRETEQDNIDRSSVDDACRDAPTKETDGTHRKPDMAVLELKAEVANEGLSSQEKIKETDVEKGFFEPDYLHKNGISTIE